MFTSLPFLLVLTIVGVVAFLTWNLSKRFAADSIQRFNDQRRDSCRVVGRAEFVDGSRHIPVALAINDQTLYYENSSMQASLDLKWIEEIAYDNELSTGQAIAHGQVLRLRSVSQGFEFILPADKVQTWQAILPSHRLADRVAV